jgi:alpha-ketoglutaric semialdehyde dehydrogenase
LSHQTEVYGISEPIMPQLSGKSIIGFRRGESESGPFHGVNPVAGDELAPSYFAASAAEVDQAAQLASTAFAIYRQTSGRARATFLRRIADNIEQLGETLVTRAAEETALPAARIRNETGRTCHQLRLFAELTEEGSWVDARIDRAEPTRAPLRKPAVRSMLRPLGPVVVFCASNFPLAFSVAGGDTASALAAGNPVIVKAHHAHPGTAELVGLAVSEAVRSCDLPEGVFSLLFGPGGEIGMQLVKHPLVKAGGFTGSRSGGHALMNAAANRAEPIPFYAEMSSVNPIFILPGALDRRSDEIAAGLHASVTLGAGQFCTNPGLVFLPDSGSEQLINKLAELMAATPPFNMLTSGIYSAYCAGVTALRQHSQVELIAQQEPASKAIREDRGSPMDHDSQARAILFQTNAISFMKDEGLSGEVFGPSTLLVRYSSVAQLPSIARSLEGQLTATIHASEEELKQSGELIGILENRAGRLLYNGFPTGVEVGHAMVHGGPFPATSDGRSTSVGTRAALRFARPVCYQDWPDSALPDELKDSNPLNIWRIVDGQITNNSLSD